MPRHDGMLVSFHQTSKVPSGKYIFKIITLALAGVLLPTLAWAPVWGS